MKKVTHSILIVFAMFLVGSFSVQAQDKDGATQMQKAKQAKADKEKKMKVKKADYTDQAKEKVDEADKMKEMKEMKERKDDYKDKMKEEKDAKKDEMDDIVLGYKKLKTEWVNRIEKAPKGEKAALEKQMMEELTAYRTEINKKRGDATQGGTATMDAKNDGASVTAGNKTDRGIAVADKEDSDNEGPISIGEAKIDAAKKKIYAKEDMIAQKRKLVAKAETKVADSKARLAAAKAKGTLNEAEIAAKEAQIARAESLIASLEASLSNGSNVLNEQKRKLTLSGDKN